MKRKRMKVRPSPDVNRKLPSVCNGAGIDIECERIGRNGKVKLTAQLNGEPVAVDSIDITKRKARNDFVSQVCESHAEIDYDAMDEELRRIAAKWASKPEKPNAKGPSDPTALLKSMPRVVVKAAEGPCSTIPTSWIGS